MTALQWIGVAIGWILMAGVTVRMWQVMEVLEIYDGLDDNAYGWALVFWPFLLALCLAGLLFIIIYGSFVALGAGLKYVMEDTPGDVLKWLKRRRATAVGPRRFTVGPDVADQPFGPPQDPFLIQAQKEVDEIAPGASE